MTEPLVSIPVADIRKVLPFISRGDVRYYLNGISVEPYNGGCLLVGTNGHVLGAVESKAARCDVARILNVSSPDFIAALKGIERESEPEYWEDDDDDDEVSSRAEFHNDVLVIEAADGRAIIKDNLELERYILPGKPFHDSKFVDWRKVMPAVDNLEPGLHSAISAHYLAYLKRVVSQVARETQVVFYHQKVDPEKASLVRFDAMHDLIVLIMPMRRDHPVEGWPSWMQQTTETAAVVT